jgi:hypothetical protein
VGLLPKTASSFVAVVALFTLLINTLGWIGPLHPVKFATHSVLLQLSHASSPKNTWPAVNVERATRPGKEILLKRPLVSNYLR